MTGLALGVIVLMTSFAVDIGRVQLERRDLQSIADTVALDMVRELDVAGDPVAWAAELTLSRDRNGFTASGSESDGIRDLVATPGCYDDATDVFTAGCATPDAVHAVATDTVDYVFQPGSKTTSREAIAEQEETAEFRVGSFVAAIDPATNSIIGQILNSVMPGASAVSYAGLLDANVTFADLAANLPVTVGSPEELLDAQITMADLLVASADALAANGNAADAAFVQGLVGLAVGGATFRFGDVVGASAGGGTPAGDVVLQVPQLLTTGAFLVDDEHFVTVPASTLNIPFVGDVGLRMTGIEAPQAGGIQDGASVTTRQISLEVTPAINVSTSQLVNICTLASAEQSVIQNAVNGILDLVRCLPLFGGVLNQLFELRVSGTPSIQVSAGEMTVTQSIDCASRTLTLTPTPVALNLNAPVQLTASAHLGGYSLGNILRITLAATASSVGTAAPVPFVAADAGPHHEIFNPPTARVGSTPLGLAGLLNVSASEISVLNANLAGTANLLLPLFQSTVNTILGQLDTVLLQPLAQLLGVSLGGGDLTPQWMQCGDGGPILSR
jgi:uncharacterized membrane protein